MLVRLRCSWQPLKGITCLWCFSCQLVPNLATSSTSMTGLKMLSPCPHNLSLNPRSWHTIGASLRSGQGLRKPKLDPHKQCRTNSVSFCQSRVNSLLLDRAPGTSSLAQMCLGLSQAPNSETPGKQSSPLCVPSELIERILALNENVVRVLISIIQMSWGVNPSFACSVDSTNMILARLLSFLSLLSARLDQASKLSLRSTMYSSEILPGLFRGQCQDPPPEPEMVQEGLRP